MKVGTLRSTVKHTGRWCSEPELLPPTVGCTVCGFREARKAVFLIQRSPDVMLLECPQCRGASASRMPTPETLECYYRTYYESRDPDEPKLTFFEPARLADHILRLTGSLNSESVRNSDCARILDFGGGDGALSVLIAERLLKRGTNVRSVAVDLVDYSAGEAEVIGGAISMSRLDGLQSAGSRCYDLVLASSIMEHIPEPRQDFIRLFQAMAPGASFYARTPWILPLLKIAPLTGLLDFTFPAHVHDFGKQLWENLVPLLGLNPEQFQLLYSHPSIVETGFSEAPLRTIAAYAMKAPWRLFPAAYNFVGGWEVIFRAVS